MNTKTKIVNKICAIMVLVAMMVCNFWVVGEAAVSYAIDMMKTNNSNVELLAYFADENGIETANKNSSIASGEETLYVKIGVRNEGYFNGKIKLENSNFQIDRTYLADGVSEITETGEVILKQINAGADEVIELKVNPIKKDELKLVELQGETTIKLEGEYTNSKNVQKDKALKVEGTAEVTLNWTLPEESALELSGEVFTNKKYELDGEEKQIVQFLVGTKITESDYPSKTNEITLTKIDGTEQVIIEGRELENKNKKISYKEKEDSIIVTIDNIDEDTVICDSEEEFIVTYILASNIDTKNKPLKITGVAQTYDEKELKAEKEINTGDEKEGITTYEVTATDEIYKGKIKTGEGKEYTTEVKINVNYEKLAKEIELTEEDAKYKIGEEEKESNIIFKETKINKEEFIKIFGEDGYLSIIDENGITIANINKDSIADEQGNIIIKYLGDTKQVQISGSKPESKGTLTIKNTKEIKADGKSREEINKLTAITEKVTSKTETVKKDINLINTVTEAKLEVSTDTLSTLETNKNVKIAVTLINNDETRDLYKNPKIRIKLPEQVKEVNMKSSLLYGNGLELASTNLVKEDGKNVIEVNLTGTQSTYNAEAVEGTTVIVYADLGLEELAPNAEEEIALSYTNEIATTYKDEGTEAVPVKIQSLTGVIITNNIEEYGVKTVGNEGTKEVKLEISKPGKGATVKSSIINNEDTTISDFKILGTFPTKQNDNLGITLRTGIQAINNEHVRVYYSDKENPTNDVADSTNNWRTDLNLQSVKNYLIVLDELAKGEKLETSYGIGIPENLDYNMVANMGYTVSYINDGTSEQNSIDSTKINLTTGNGPSLDISLKEMVGDDTVGEGKDSSEEMNKAVTLGEIIRYQLKLTNTGTAPATNINITEKAPTGVVGLDYVKDEQMQDDEENIAGAPLHYFKEMVSEGDAPLLINKTIENLNIGESTTINFYVRPTALQDSHLTSEFNLSYNGKTVTKYVTNPLNQSDVNITLLPGHLGADRNYLVSGNQYMYKLSLENLSNEDINNVKIQIVTSDLLDINCIAYDVNGEAVIKNNTREITIENLKKGDETGSITNIRVYAKPKENIGEDNIAQIYAKATYGNVLLRSNKLANTVKVLNANANIETANPGGEIKVGDRVEYSLTVKNDENGIDMKDLTIEDTLSRFLDINEVSINDEILTADEYSIKPVLNFVSEDNTVAEDSRTLQTLDISTKLNAGETKTIKIKATLSNLASLRLKETTNITNSAVLRYGGETITETNEATYIFDPSQNSIGEEKSDKYEKYKDIEPVEPQKENNVSEPETDTENTENPENIENTENTENQNTPEPQENTGNSGELNNSESTETPSNPSENSSEEKPVEEEPEEKTYTISGTAWFDENENGGRESSEQKLGGVNVKLLNLDTNEIKDLVTSDNGFYSATGLKKGKYVVIFEYDSDKYMLTTYQTKDIDVSKNSDVEKVPIKLDGVEKNVDSTDTLVIEDKNITDIDLGLVTAKVFDLELTKTISKVTVTNKEGTKTTNYDGATFAKTEIDSKYLEGSTIIIEYKIKVTNAGELAGYAKSIIDYKPSDLKFDSELNSGWYQSGANVYCSSLANTKIEPNETKELTLVLTKTMTDNNIGLVNNLAEIAEDYNAFGIPDKDSVPGNKEKGEDDLGSCNVTMGVKTGAAIGFIAITISLFGILIVGAYLLNKIMIKKRNI